MALRCMASDSVSPAQVFSGVLAVSILPELIGKGGLRAQIKSNGIVRLGDSCG